MDHMWFSRNDECHFINTNNYLNSSHEDEIPLFLDFPSPFFDDDISIKPILENNQTHLSSPTKPVNTVESSPATELKRIKKRSAGKKDRHSKINTAQGLRDRRMRLSLHIARKFFHLQDLLGFDKASKTIEWLFCKSNKAIKEVADNFNPKQTNQSVCEETERMDCDQIKADISSKEEEIKNRECSRKQIQNNLSVKETRDLARARARDRTRERLMIKELEKSKHLFGGNPNDEIYRFGLRCIPSPNNHKLEELGYPSVGSSKPIQQEPSNLSFENSSTRHLLQELQSEAINVNNYSGTIVGASSTYCSTLINHNRPAGWLNYSNKISGVPGDWDAGSFITEHCNYGAVPSPAGHLTGDIYEQNPSSFLLSNIANIMHFQSQNPEN